MIPVPIIVRTEPVNSWEYPGTILYRMIDNDPTRLEPAE